MKKTVTVTVTNTYEITTRGKKCGNFCAGLYRDHYHGHRCIIFKEELKSNDPENDYSDYPDEEPLLRCKECLKHR